MSDAIQTRARFCDYTWAQYESLIPALNKKMMEAGYQPTGFTWTEDGVLSFAQSMIEIKEVAGSDIPERIKHYVRFLSVCYTKQLGHVHVYVNAELLDDGDVPPELGGTGATPEPYWVLELKFYDPPSGRGHKPDGLNMYHIKFNNVYDEDLKDLPQIEEKAVKALAVMAI